MPTDPLITSLHINNYKSILGEVNLVLSPLTILAGANSSGKSSLIQPLLLLKQTVEATTDPGPLQIDGPNVFFSVARDQLFTKNKDGSREKRFSVGVTLNDKQTVNLSFGSTLGGLKLRRMLYSDKALGPVAVHPGMPTEVLGELIKREERFASLSIDERADREYTLGSIRLKPRVRRERCFFSVTLDTIGIEENLRLPVIAPGNAISRALKNIIHVPAFRDISPRNLPAAYARDLFVGEFDDYVGSLILYWQRSPKHRHKLQSLNSDLESLGLASAVHAIADNDVELTLSVAPIGAPNRKMRFELTDVGFGVSQALSVLVALRAAGPKHLVYVEEPESHLHPRAQFELAAIVAEMVRRGSRVILETHSAFLLLGIQEQIALRNLNGDDVMLHWTKLVDGYTQVESSVPSNSGSLGQWPVDFGDTLMFAQDRFLSAFERQAGDRL